MTCNNCGSQQAEDVRFCSNCGSALSVVTPPATQPHPQPMYRTGRGGVILTLGILAIVLLGPITGIPAWVMGHHDLKEINAGLIPQTERGMTSTGMILGIIGTCLGVIILLGIFISILIAVLSFGAG